MINAAQSILGLRQSGVSKLLFGVPAIPYAIGHTSGYYTTGEDTPTDNQIESTNNIPNYNESQQINQQDSPSSSSSVSPSISSTQNTYLVPQTNKQSKISNKNTKDNVHHGAGSDMFRALGLNSTASDLLGMGAYAVPGLSAALSAKDAYDSFKRGDWGWGAINAAMIPFGFMGLGGAGKTAINAVKNTKWLSRLKNIFKDGGQINYNVQIKYNNMYYKLGGRLPLYKH